MPDEEDGTDEALDAEIVPAVVPVAPDDPDLNQVFAAAAGTLQAMVGATLDAITVRSIDPSEARLLGDNVSKVSPLTSTLLEHRTVTDLAAATEGGRFEIERQDPGFPDAGVYENGLPTGHGIEVKAHNVLASEITGRFRASQAALAGRQIYVALVAWVMDHIFFGSPHILDVQLVDAMSIARARDAHYNRPPGYVVSEPEDNTGRRMSAQLRNVEGHVLQTHTDEDLARVRVIMDALLAKADLGDPQQAETAELTTYLRRNLSYRLDTNFAKVDRVNHPQIEDFKARNLTREYRGRTISSWRQVLADLKSANDGVRAAAEAAVAALYAGD